MPSLRLAFSDPSRSRLRRMQVWIGLSVAVGAMTGVGVAGVHLVIQDVSWSRFSATDAWWVPLLPIGALLLSSLFVWASREPSTATTEAYVRVFHEPDGHIRLRSVPLRLAAAAATIGLGGSMGLEGPSIYLGSAVGDAAERRFHRLFSMEDSKILLVAGAAAGIAAIFKAPVTGILFALEVPYQDDLARHALIPAMFAAATSYVVFVAFTGTSPFFPIAPVRLRFEDLLVALAVGVACGIAARIFVMLLRIVEQLSRRLSFWVRPVVGGAVLALIGWLALVTYHLPLPLGPGYNGILLAARGRIAADLLLLLLVLKMVATSATVGGNGVGGLFFPSVMMGAALGGAIGHVVPGPASLFAVVGIAAFLGGAYKVPLAGVAFVAETTGAPAYVIPGLLAAALGYLVSGGSSLSKRQRFRRRSDVESRLDVGVADVMSREWMEVRPGATVADFVSRYVILGRSKIMPVTDAGRYLGMIRLDAVRSIPAERYDDVRVEEIVERDYPTADPTWRLNRALSVMRSRDVERLPVLDGGRIVGMISAAEVLRLAEVLEAVEEDGRSG